MTAATPAADSVTLQPRPWVPLGVMALALPAGLSPVGWRAGLPLLLFGLFLLSQAALLRLCFTADALVVQRAGQEIRRFPYGDWQAWRLFWGPLPVLFWFREVHSIHLLPMLFDARGLQEQLERRLPHLSRAGAAPSAADGSGG
jgi:hypothetical protein